MFGGTDPKKREFLWIDGKKHTIQIKENDDRVDLIQLTKTYHKMATEKEEQCKPIFYLGVSLTGDPLAAKYFLYGWLVKSIRDTVEKNGNSKWVIDHVVDEISEEEARNHVADQLEELATELRTNSEYNVIKTPILRGDADGTELYN